MNSGAIITDGFYLYTTLDHRVGLMGVQVRDCHGSLTKYNTPWTLASQTTRHFNILLTFSWV